MLIDSEKKPLGEEISRSAPIKNIISLEHQRTGILRLILNFGIVRVVVADEELIFYDVHNPAQVQQDIYYRQEQIKLNKEESGDGTGPGTHLPLAAGLSRDPDRGESLR